MVRVQLCWLQLTKGDSVKNANYRKLNDRTLSSSTYHKKDGTNVRAILKAELHNDILKAKLYYQTKSIAN